MGWIYIIPILAFLIIIHELGHFFAARSVGVEVEEFGIGIPPRVKGWRRKGVLWSINAIPFGGFVRVRGEDGKDVSRGSYNAASPWQRAWFLFAGPLMNLLVALILTIILLGVQGQPTNTSPLYIGEVSLNSPAEAAGWQPGDRVVAVNGEVLNDQNDAVNAIKDGAGQEIEVTIRRGNEEIISKVTPRENPPANQGAIGIRFTDGTLSDVSVDSVDANSAAATAGLQSGDRIVQINGVQIEAFAQAMGLMNSAQGTTVDLTIERDGQQQTVTLDVPSPSIQITDVASNSAASDARLYAGDEITEINGAAVTNSSDLTQAFVDNVGKDVDLTVLRDGKTVNVTIRVPAVDTASEDPVAAAGISGGSVSGFASSGITPIGTIQYDKVPASQVLQRGWEAFWNLITQTFSSLRMIFQGDVSRDQLAGPVGMAQITGELLDKSSQPAWVTLTNITIMISLSLGFFNLLPFPALDGGRLMFVALEIIRGGRKVAPEKEGLVHMVGMLMLLALMFFIMWGDISRLINGQSFMP